MVQNHPPVQIRAEPRTRVPDLQLGLLPLCHIPLHCTGSHRCHSGPWLILLPDQAPFPRALCSGPSYSLNSTTSQTNQPSNQQTNQTALLLSPLPWQRHYRTSHTRMWEASSSFSCTPRGISRDASAHAFLQRQSGLRWEVRSHYKLCHL